MSEINRSMAEKATTRDISVWVQELHDYFQVKAPDLMSLFETYAGEAVFGRRYLHDEISKLPLNAKILEIGAGSFILTCQLKREGFDITGLEPVSEGFSHFERMRSLVLAHARDSDCVPLILESTGEELNMSSAFDFAFSQNVMEHVHDVAIVIENVGKALKVGAVYRFTCPNYLFPYEPHFNMPTLFSRSLTEKVMMNHIRSKKALLDPIGVWNSLNWINVIQIKAIVKKAGYLKVIFNTKMLVDTFERIGTDSVFAARRTRKVQNLLNFLVRIKIHKLFGFAPAAIQPIIDCRIERTS